MNKLLATISYDGTNFMGWVRQPNERTVQGEVEKLLSKIYDEEIKVVGCSRTDRGVHAINYLFTFKADNTRTLIQLQSFFRNNAPDILFLSMKIVDEDFQVRYDSKGKKYIYKINTSKESEIFRRGHYLNYFKPLRTSSMKKTGKIFEGTGDFASFSSKEERENTIRTIYHVKVKKTSDSIIISIEGNAFLRYMVRNIVGSILAVEDGIITRKEITQLLRKPKVGSSKWKAEAKGLYLREVLY